MTFYFKMFFQHVLDRSFKLDLSSLFATCFVFSIYIINNCVLQLVAVTSLETTVTGPVPVTQQTPSTPPRRVMRPQECVSVTSTGQAARVTRILTSALPGLLHARLTLRVPTEKTVLTVPVTVASYRTVENVQVTCLVEFLLLYDYKSNPS